MKESDETQNIVCHYCGKKMMFGYSDGYPVGDPEFVGMFLLTPKRRQKQSRCGICVQCFKENASSDLVQLFLE